MPICHLRLSARSTFTSATSTASLRPAGRVLRPHVAVRASSGVNVSSPVSANEYESDAPAWSASSSSTGRLADGQDKTKLSHETTLPGFDVQIGEMVSGVVRGLQPYGAWIDYGGPCDGLLRRQYFSHVRVDDLRPYLALDEEVQALVVGTDPDRGHVTLSTKWLEREPGGMLRSPRLLVDSPEEAAELMKRRQSERVERTAAAWVRMGKLHAEATTVLVMVQQVKPDGLVVTFDQLRGFLPWQNDGALQGGGDEGLEGQQLTAVITKACEESGCLEFEYRPRPALDVQVGQWVTCVVSSVLTQHAWLDYGGSRDALLHHDCFSRERCDSLVDHLFAGEELTAIVQSVHPDTGLVAVSTKWLERIPGGMLTNPRLLFDTPAEAEAKKLQVQALWAENEAVLWPRLHQMHEQGTVVQVTVHAVKPKGLIVVIEGRRGFIPWQNARAVQGQNNLIGQQLPAVITRLDQEVNKILLRHRPQPTGLEDIQVGQMLTGVVLSVQPYGAYIDYGGSTAGLLHTSRFSRQRTASLSEHLSLGEEIKAIVHSFDADTDHVVLSTKWLERTPGAMLRKPRLLYDTAEEAAAEKVLSVVRSSSDWQNVQEAKRPGKTAVMSIKVGQLLEGNVLAVKQYGAFVDVGGGVVGLLHVSQVSQARFKNLSDVLAEGDSIKVIILSVDHTLERVSFSTKLLERVRGGMLCSPRLVFDTVEQMAEAA